ncbi:MAG: hypothetical protein F4X17_20655 [Gemmatimonadetes bacterium]|nr:hypothetical protein [Gemmatimonadota bacterium]
MLRLKMTVKERLREARMELMKRKTTAQFWRSKGLSVRASNCLSMANIIDEQELIEKIATLDCLLALRNCGRQTAEEIWAFLTNLKLTSEYHQGIEITSSNSGDDHSAEAQSIFVPLLNIEVSTDTWKVLQNTPVNSIRWSVRTRNVIGQQGLQGLAEIAKHSPREWLRFRNFGNTSLTEIQENMTEIIEQLRVNSGVLDVSDDHSAEAQSIFVPLLNIEVSTDTWKVLQNTPINSIRWSIRTQNVLLKKDFKTLAEIAEFPPKKWLRFKNFGIKSLTEIQEIVNKIIVNPDIIDPTDEHSAELPQIQTLSELGHVVFQRLQTRQQEIIRHYYGYGEIPKNLQQIGEALGISRERVRQLKKVVNTKISQGMDNHLITITIFRLLSELIRDVLAKDDGWCSVENLQEIIHQRLGWGDGEQWIIDWFDEAFGETWICLGTDDYKIINGVCQLKSAEPIQSFLIQLVARLQYYGYRPLALEECQRLIKKTDKFDPDQLLDVITHYPSLKIYRYGKTHIGLKEWTWFNPEKPTTTTGQASLIEWYLRMANEPATAKAVANGIGSQLGNFRLTPFDVANTCEKYSHRFQAYNNDAYGLYLWEGASKYRQALTKLLSDEPLPIERITEVLYLQESADTTLIVAALNFYTNSFVETMPFEWALKTQMGKIVEEEIDFDYTNLTFEDLMPKL